MAAEPVATVRRWYERLNAGDPGVELCSEEIEIRNWSEMPTPGPYHGHEGVRRWWRDVNDEDVGVDMRLFDAEELVEVDDERVVVVQRARGRTRFTELEVDYLWGAVITVRGGKVAAAFGYPTPAEAKRAAGLEAGEV